MSAKNDNPTGFPTPDFDAAADRVRQLNEKVIAAAKQGGNVSLDVYERTLTSVLELEQQLAGASQLDWVSAFAKAHADFVTDVSSTVTSAAREQLK